MLRYYPKTKKVRLVKKTILNNKNNTKVKPNYVCLREIFDLLMDWCANTRIKVFAKEKSISKYHTETQAIFRVVGIADYILGVLHDREWQDVPISVAKKTLTGNGLAQKKLVAKYLTLYIGEHKYRSNDESDAVAIGIAWLINNGYLEKNCPPEDTLKEAVFTADASDWGDEELLKQAEEEELS